MALTVTVTGIQWDTASAGSIAAGAERTSDEFSSAGSVFQAYFTFAASNVGTPAAGDTMDFYFLHSADGVNFATGSQGNHLTRLDTNAYNPARSSVWVPGPFKDWKIFAVNNSAGRTINAEASMIGHSA